MSKKIDICREYVIPIPLNIARFKDLALGSSHTNIIYHVRIVPFEKRGQHIGCKCIVCRTPTSGPCEIYPKNSLMINVVLVVGEFTFNIGKQDNAAGNRQRQSNNIDQRIRLLREKLRSAIPIKRALYLILSLFCKVVMFDIPEIEGISQVGLHPHQESSKVPNI